MAIFPPNSFSPQTPSEYVKNFNEMFTYHVGANKCMGMSTTEGNPK